jgi:hypothetical protein
MLNVSYNVYQKLLYLFVHDDNFYKSEGLEYYLKSKRYPKPLKKI